MMLTSLLATLALSPSVQAWHKHKAHHHKEHSHHKHVPAPICKPEYKVECLYQVGGGPTTATGGQTVPQLTGAKLAECIPTFKKYFAEVCCSCALWLHLGPAFLYIVLLAFCTCDFLRAGRPLSHAGKAV
jgi:hypothetical protein